MSEYTPHFYHLPASVQTVVQLLAHELQPKSVVLFGSRARGKHRPNSDFDLCVVGRTQSDQHFHQLLSRIDEDPLSLYALDIVEFEKLNRNYQQQIQAEGITLYDHS